LELGTIEGGYNVDDEEALYSDNSLVDSDEERE
jgi:hypothetical protein